MPNKLIKYEYLNVTKTNTNKKIISPRLILNSRIQQQSINGITVSTAETDTDENTPWLVEQTPYSMNGFKMVDQNTGDDEDDEDDEDEPDKDIIGDDGNSGEEAGDEELDEEAGEYEEDEDIGELDDDEDEFDQGDEEDDLGDEDEFDDDEIDLDENDEDDGDD